MKPTLNRKYFAPLILAAALSITFTPLMASEEVDDDHTEIVYKMVIDCDEDSAGDCEKEIRIQSTGGNSHVMQLGDHQMVWVEGDQHGSHYSMAHAFGGKGGFLGVQLTDLTPELRTHFGVADDEGVMVSKVVDESAAFRAGIEVGDIITRVDGEGVESTGDLTHAVRSHEQGDTLDLEIWRAGSYQSLSATLDEHEALGQFARRISIGCEEGDDDCEIHILGHPHRGMDIDCPDDEDCEIKIDCSDGDCDCTVDGAAVDCQELHSEHGSGH